MRSLQAARDRYPTILAAILMAALVITTLVTSGPAAADTDDDSDDTRAGAYDLGDITNQARVATETGSLDGVDDTVDYFRFSLTDTREVMLKLRQLDAPTHLYLEDQDGNVLASSKNPGTQNETITQELDAGTYYARAKAARRGSNSYQLRYKSTENIPDNVAATGTPTITGTAEVGETLTAGTSGISDENGLESAVFTHQWLRNDTDISGATGATYRLTAYDEGNTIKVRVAFTDDDGYSETLTSAATGSVTRPANVAATGQPAITGTAQVGDTLNADTSAIDDENGLDNVQFTYQWVRNDGNSDAEIPGATGSAYDLTTGDTGHTIKVRVSFTDDHEYPETATSAPTSIVNRPPNALPTGMPTITGILDAGESLSVDTSAIQDLNGLSDPGFTYQWLTTDGSTDSAISGATGSAYTVPDSDEGSTFKVSVSFTDDHGYAHTLTSDAVLIVSHAHNDDCPEDETTTCSLSLTTFFDGNIHNPGNNYEEDWVKLSGVFTGWYEFRLQGRGLNRSPSLTMIIRKEGERSGKVANGTHVYRNVNGNDAGQLGSPANLFIGVRGEDGDYRLSVSRKSYVEPRGADLPNDETTAGWLEVGYDPYPGKSGNVSYRNDDDSFVVDLEAGKSYRIDVKGNEGADYGGSAPDTVLSLTMPDATSATLLNPITGIVTHISVGGVPSQAMIATGGGQGDNARLDIAVNTSGQFLITASDSNSTGAYTVTVKDHFFRGSASELPSLDLPPGFNTYGYVEVNGPGATGDLDPVGDSDMFKVDLAQGQSYRFEVDDAPAGDPVCNPLVELRGPESQGLTDTTYATPTTSDAPISMGILDRDSGPGDHPKLEVNVHRTGRYHLRVGSQCSTTSGDYLVTAVNTTGPHRVFGPRGSKQSVSEGSGQDLPNFLTSRGHAQVNGDGATGRIANANDVDVFAVKMYQHTQYRIDVWGDDTDQDGGSLNDPKVALRNHAFDPAKNAGDIEQLGIDRYQQFIDQGGILDNDSGSGKNARIEVAPHWSQRTYYIQVSSQDGGTGTYTVYVTETGKDRRIAPRGLTDGVPPVHSKFPTFSEPKDEDLPHDTTTDGRLKPVGNRAHGNIDPSYDIDYFEAKLVSGYSYRIDMKGQNNSEPGGTLVDPALWLIDHNGNDISEDSENVTPTLADSASGNRIADDSSGSGNNARLEIDVKETQTYYIQADNDGGGGGTYTVQLTILGKHGHTLPPQGTTRTVSEGDTDLREHLPIRGFVRPSGDPATGKIGTNGDNDVFRTKFLADHRYRIDLTGSESTDKGGTLADPLLAVLDSNLTLIDNIDDIAPLNFDISAGYFASIADDDRGAGNNPMILVHVNRTGNYYLRVSEDGEDATGTYTLQVTALGEAE